MPPCEVADTPFHIQGDDDKPTFDWHRDLVISERHPRVTYQSVFFDLRVIGLPLNYSQIRLV